jgi:SPP1 family predicted phage head-tail adaptor
MQAGTLNRRIIIQAPSTVQDASGQPTDAWTNLLTTWANLRAVTGKEVYASSGFVSELTHVVTIRYPSVTVNSTMRVLYDSRIFQIQAVIDPNEDRKQIDLLCKEENT